MGLAAGGAYLAGILPLLTLSERAGAEGELTAVNGPAGALEPAVRVRLNEALTFPVDPAGGVILLDNFGGFSVSAGACSHAGVDVFPTDTDPRDLLACVDGVIEGQRFAGSSGSQGNAWILKDDAGVSYRYHHIDEFAEGLEVGSVVQRGDVIATMGSTGNASSAHLHFEVRLDGTSASAVDPLPRFVLPIDNVEVGPPAGCS